MKRLLLTVAGCFALGSIALAQTSLFLEDFESGGSSFTLNTTTLGGQSGLTGDNAWVVNNAYAGGSGTSSCFSLSFNIGNTPNQPAGIANGPNSNYLHILSDDGTNNGITNANYSAADGSICFLAQSHFAEMTNDISTTGFTNVEIDFWWTCLGDVNAFGEVYYSTDAGITWTVVTNPISNYYGSSNWANQVIQNAAWDNQASLRFGFRFVNNAATNGGDPSFSIDDFEVFGTSSGGGSNDITTGTSLTPVEWCEGTTTTMQVDFTSTGTFNPGNTYSVQLSDGTGSFAAPTVIGTQASTANSGTITTIIPNTTPAGAGYRVRVVSDDPATIGTDNGSDMTIHALPNVTHTTFANVCDTDPFFTLTGGTPSGGTYTGTGVTAGVFDPSAAGVGTHTITYTFTDGNGCTASTDETITVDACGGIDTYSVETFTVAPNPTNESFSISTEMKIDRVELLDLQGRVVKTFVKDNVYEIQEIPAGMYVVVVSSGDQQGQTRLLID